MSSHMFELFFRLPVEGVSRDVLDNAIGNKFQMQRHLPFDDGLSRDVVVATRVRAFDAKSYHFCRLLVRERAFGHLNKRYFLFRDLNSGVEYVLDSEEVAKMCGTTRKEPYFKLAKINARSAS